MSPAKKSTSKSGAAKKTATKVVKKAVGKAKTAVKKSPAKKATATKTAAKKAPGKTSAKKTTAKKATAKKTSAKKAPGKTSAKKTTAKKATAKKTSAKKAPSAKSATGGAKKTVTTAPGKKGGAAEPAEAAPAKPIKKPLIRRPAPKAAPAKKVRPAKLDKEDLERIRTQLQDERSDLERQLDELQGASFTGSQSDLTGEVGLDEDFADAGTATFDRERDLSIRNNIRDLIDQITRALTRIDEGGYGTCERCGNPIDASRLKALPHASLCLDCKRREERVR